MKPSHASSSNHSCISSATSSAGPHVAVLGEPEPRHELPDRESLVARNAEHSRHIALEPLADTLDRRQWERVVQAVAPEIEAVERAAQVLDRALQPDLLPARGLDRLGGLPRRRDEGGARRKDSDPVRIPAVLDRLCFKLAIELLADADAVGTWREHAIDQARRER